MRRCPKCKGTGTLTFPKIPNTCNQFEQKCTRCSGKGKVEK